MVGGLTCRCRTAKVALDAVVAHTCNGHRAALHEEVLLTVDSIADGRGDVQCQILDFDIRCRLDAMLQVAHHVQRSVALQLQLAFRIDAGFLRATTVSQCVFRIFLCT